MPLYDYECTECGHPFEESVRIADMDKPMACESCGAPARRLISGGSFLLRGGGWSKKGHHKIVPATPDPTLDHNIKTSYYNCTPESVHND